MREERLELQSFLAQNMKTFYPSSVLPYTVRLAFSPEELIINTYTELENFLDNDELFGLMYIGHIEIGAFALLHQISIKMTVVDKNNIYTVSYNDSDDDRMVVHVLNCMEHFSTILQPHEQHLHFHPSVDNDGSDPAPSTFSSDEYNSNFPPLQQSERQRQQQHRSGASEHYRQQQRRPHNHGLAHPPGRGHEKCDQPAQHLGTQVEDDSHGLALGSQGYGGLQHHEGVEHDGGHVVGDDSVNMLTDGRGGVVEKVH